MCTYAQSFGALFSKNYAASQIRKVLPNHYTRPICSHHNYSKLVFLYFLAGIELNPLELNSLYEHLYDLGTILQTNQCMVLFEEGFRPWPHIYKNKGRAKKFYKAIDGDLNEDLQRLRPQLEREDASKYTGIMCEVFGCFGSGIIDSLEFTLKKYLRQTNGSLRNDVREEWEKDAVGKMVCHNNFAERPFAVVKAFWRMYPSLSLYNLSWLGNSMVNGTHRCAEVFGKHNKLAPVTTRLAGIAITAHPDLKRAVNVLCSVRRKTKGRITLLAREAHKADKEFQIATRKLKAKDKYAAQVQKQARTAASRDKAEQTASNSLCKDLHDLNIQLKARGNQKNSRVSYLKDQVYARIAGEHPRLYPALGSEWRKAGGKIRVSASSTDQSDEDYLTKLVAAMIAEDTISCGVNESMSNGSTQDYIRILPSISDDFTNPKAKVYKHEFAQHIAELATPVDDPIYIELHSKYHGAILYDNETRARQKLFRIAGIQFVRSFTKNRPSCWEATCEPVFRDAATGTYVVPHEHKVEGSNVLFATALQGYLQQPLP